MMKIAAGVRRDLKMGTQEFPQGSPTRGLLETVIAPREVGKSQSWFSQAFLPNATFSGHTQQEVCLTRIISEVKDIMAAEKKMMQIRIPPDLHKWFKLYATKNETTMTEVLISYLYSLKRKEEQSVDVEQF
jgi:hypothetical protein